MSRRKHVKFSLNKGGPPSKGKYQLNTDSEEVPWGKVWKKEPIRGVKRSENPMFNSSWSSKATTYLVYNGSASLYIERV